MMDIEELALELEKLKYQVKTLAYTVDHNTYPVESLVLDMDWGEEQLNQAHDIFEKYDNKLHDKQKINWTSFEMELREKFGIDYQKVKPIILAFFKNEQWTDVCRGYAMSFEPTTPVEFHRITRDSNRDL